MMKLKDLFGVIVAVVYFIFPMSLVILMLLLTPLMFPNAISTIINSGFAGPGKEWGFIAMCGFFISLSLLIPVLRRIYLSLPWFYPFIKIFFMNFIIMNIGILILNYGYQVNNEARHIVFFSIMVLQLLICRIAMCFYFKYRPVKAYVER